MALGRWKIQFCHAVSRAKIFEFHGLRSGEAQIGFKPGKTVGRETGALFEEHAHLVVPIDVVERESDEAEFFRDLAIEQSAACALGRIEVGGVCQKAAGEPGQPVRHRIGAEIDVGESDHGRGLIVAPLSNPPPLAGEGREGANM